MQWLLSSLSSMGNVAKNKKAIVGANAFFWVGCCREEERNNSYHHLFL
jgi:hypothetical protein